MPSTDTLSRVARGFLQVTRDYAESLDPARGAPALARLEQLERALRSASRSGDLERLLGVAREIHRQGATLLEPVPSEPVKA